MGWEMQTAGQLLISLALVLPQSSSSSLLLCTWKANLCKTGSKFIGSPRWGDDSRSRRVFAEASPKPTQEPLIAEVSAK